MHVAGVTIKKLESKGWYLISHHPNRAKLLLWGHYRGAWKVKAGMRRFIKIVHHWPRRTA